MFIVLLSLRIVNDVDSESVDMMKSYVPVIW